MKAASQSVSSQHAMKIQPILQIYVISLIVNDSSMYVSFFDLLMFNQNVTTGSFGEYHRFLCDNICHLVHLKPTPPKSTVSLHSLSSATATSQNTVVLQLMDKKRSPRSIFFLYQ